MRSDLFVKLKYESSTIILFVEIRYSMVTRWPCLWLSVWRNLRQRSEKNVQPRDHRSVPTQMDQ